VTYTPSTKAGTFAGYTPYTPTTKTPGIGIPPIKPPVTPILLPPSGERKGRRPWDQFPIDYVDVIHPVSGLRGAFYGLPEIISGPQFKIENLFWEKSGDVPERVIESRPKVRVSRPSRAVKSSTEFLQGRYSMQELAGPSSFKPSKSALLKRTKDEIRFNVKISDPFKPSRKGSKRKGRGMFDIDLGFTL
jgi:hypothetical protein